MKKILIVYDCDNGYSCGCCGRKWQEHEIYEVKDNINVEKFVKKQNDFYGKSYDKSSDRYGRFAVSEAYVITEEIKV